MIRFPDFGTTIFAVCAKLVLSMTACLFLVIGPYRVFAQDRPNVLFLFADDFTYEAISAFGHTDIETPNLDRLVSRGTTFTHAYNMGSWSGAVCVASVCPEIASSVFFPIRNADFATRRMNIRRYFL